MIIDCTNQRRNVQVGSGARTDYIGLYRIQYQKVRLRKAKGPKADTLTTRRRCNSALGQFSHVQGAQQPTGQDLLARPRLRKNGLYKKNRQFKPLAGGKPKGPETVVQKGEAYSRRRRALRSHGSHENTICPTAQNLDTTPRWKSGAAHQLPFYLWRLGPATSPGRRKVSQVVPMMLAVFRPPVAAASERNRAREVCKSRRRAAFLGHRLLTGYMIQMYTIRRRGKDRR
jgi:hypothetical protein